MRKTIWMNPPLEKLADKCTGKGRDGKFSRRLGDIVERYDALVTLTKSPEMSDDEKMILGAVVCGSTISSVTIKYLHESIVESGAGEPEALKKFATKVAKWSAAERLSAIESLDI